MSITYPWHLSKIRKKYNLDRCFWLSQILDGILALPFTGCITLNKLPKPCQSMCLICKAWIKSGHSSRESPWKINHIMNGEYLVQCQEACVWSQSHKGSRLLLYLENTNSLSKDNGVLSEDLLPYKWFLNNYLNIPTPRWEKVEVFYPEIHRTHEKKMETTTLVDGIE